MSVELKVPQVGESITEVIIGDWLKAEGESVALDEALVVLETDKVTVELPAPKAGKLLQILKQTGETALVGEVIGHLEAGATGEAPVTPAPAPKSAEPHVMPAAQRALAQSGRSAEEISGSGPGGRVQKYDVEGLPAAKSVEPGPSIQSGPSTQSGKPVTQAGARSEEIVPMSPLRKRVAQRLVEAQNTAAILTTFNEVDMSAVRNLRKSQQERFQSKHGVKLGFMSFFVKASIEALKLVPGVNAEIRGTDIAYRNYFDIGVAVGGGKGLVVPILRDAERLSFAEVELAIAEYAKRAASNKLTLDELTGGTFTISNGGIYGSLLSTPILNPPQSGILGLHAIEDRAVVVDGQVVVRPMMYVALSYDHRMVDGREAVTFLKHIKDCIEEPGLILLEA